MTVWACAAWRAMLERVGHWSLYARSITKDAPWEDPTAGQTKLAATMPRLAPETPRKSTIVRGKQDSRRQLEIGALRRFACPLDWIGAAAAENLYFSIVFF